MSIACSLIDYNILLDNFAVVLSLSEYYHCTMTTYHYYNYDQYSFFNDADSLLSRVNLQLDLDLVLYEALHPILTSNDFKLITNFINLNM